MTSRGRKYFGQLAKQYEVEGLTPDAVYEKPSKVILKRGPIESKRGGRIASRDLKEVGPGKERRRQLSDEFLKQPPVEFDESDE